MKNIGGFLIMIVMANSVFAGFNNLTIHSRANCGNNESISWDARKSYVLLTVSDHILNGSLKHSLSSGWENTWRSANVHWGEAKPGSGWYVQAGHYIQINGRVSLLGYTTADDCNIYDGWWDKK